MITNTPGIDTSRRVIAKVTRERRSDPLDDESVQLQSEPAKVRFRVLRRYGWSDDQTQKEI
jgi:hypothetical protein